MRILITGGGGQLGQALSALAWPQDVLLLTPPARDAGFVR